MNVSFPKRKKPWFSRTDMAVRLLRLGKAKKAPSGKGLIWVQIDGFSMSELQRALKNGRLPFIKSLLEGGHYRRHTLYSGLPSVTPAVQGELLYGVKTCVPAFSFFDRQNAKMRIMQERPAAKMVEERLKKQGEGLLEGGSAYSNIFTGGASEAHICASDWGLSGILHAINPLFLPFLVLCYLDVFVITALLLVLELVLAVVECIRGSLRGWEFFKELEFVWIRVMICVCLREVVMVGACIDIVRGMPVIHMNMIGYDEQSHRRGPSSLYAHWTLQGIDHAVRQIFETLNQSHQDYEVWIFSDHGQQRTIPYSLLHHETLTQTLTKIWRTKRGKSIPANNFKTELIVADMGPEAHVYFSSMPRFIEIEEFVYKIFAKTRIPMAMMVAEDGQVIAWTRKGKFLLPQQADQVIGRKHIFFEEVSQDMVAVCRHPDAGDLILGGWAQGEVPLTFPMENGSHGTAGPEETRAFAILPADTLLPEDRAYLRPLDLWQAGWRVRRGEQKVSNDESFRCVCPVPGE